LKKAAGHVHTNEVLEFTEVRNADQLAKCDALIIPGGESTTISLVAAQSGLLEPLRDFVKYVNTNVSFVVAIYSFALSESNASQHGEHAQA
jgi:5'-phosphate synthase pdxT subunit